MKQKNSNLLTMLAAVLVLAGTFGAFASSKTVVAQQFPNQLPQSPPIPRPDTYAPARRLAQVAPIPATTTPNSQSTTPPFVSAPTPAPATRSFQTNTLPAQPGFNPSTVRTAAPNMVVSPLTVRVKDITTIQGHRSHHLQGVGLVNGLRGTGDSSGLARQLQSNFLRNFGIFPRQSGAKSLSAVSVYIEIPPFAKKGEYFRATVSVMDNATSLYGGTLLRTALEGVDGNTYAFAEGQLVIGGFSAEGAAGGVDKNHATVGRVKATLEETICGETAIEGNALRLLLKNKDSTTAFRIANKINEHFPHTAEAIDPGLVVVQIPPAFARNKISFLVMVQDMPVRPDVKARVVINEKTGTIVIGQNVKISGVVFAKDNLIITTNEAPVVSQPAPLSEGDTVVLPRTQLQAVEQGGRYNTLNANTTVGELATALNMLGVTPQDLISVFESIEQSGALHAELVRQ